MSYGFGTIITVILLFWIILPIIDRIRCGTCQNCGKLCYTSRRIQDDKGQWFCTKKCRNEYHSRLTKKTQRF